MQDFSDLRPTLLQLADALTQRGWMLATAESCTGGLIAAACTDLPGSSAWFDRGFVTYSNAAKTQMLGVPESLIAQHGAVSEAVVLAMANGAVAQSAAQVSISVSGVAGPSGGSPAKPVGLVWLGFSIQGHTHSQCLRLAGDRATIRQQAVYSALTHCYELLISTPTLRHHHS